MSAQDPMIEAVGDARFHALAFAVDDAVVVTDTHNIVRFANPVAETLFHSNGRAITGRPFGLLLSALRSGPHSIALPDGREMSAIVTVSATIWDGKVGWLAVLKAQPSAATEIDAVETLLAAMRARFLAHVSHELRTPLNTILGFAETMAEELFGPHSNPRYRQYAMDILTSSQRLSGLVTDMIELSRADSGDLALDEQIIDLSSLIADVVPQAEAAARSQGADLAMGSLEPILLRGDPGKLRRALLHLLANGLAFTPSGGAVQVSTQLARDGRVLIRVADSGRGFSAHQLAQAFQPFPRVRTVDQADPQAGLGVGLALVRRFIELHGGAVRIESRQGQGTTVTCMLPKARVALDVAPRLPH
jgi:signal transduction histidine kinase